MSDLANRRRFLGLAGTLGLLSACQTSDEGASSAQARAAWARR